MFAASQVIDNQHIDPVYHHVHHAQILLILEQNRDLFLNSTGFTRAQLAVRELFIVLSEIQVRFLREITRQTYQVICKDMVIKDKKLLMRQEMRDPRGKIAVEADFTMMMIDGVSRRAVSPPDDFKRAYTKVD